MDEREGQRRFTEKLETISPLHVQAETDAGHVLANTALRAAAKMNGGVFVRMTVAMLMLDSLCVEYPGCRRLIEALIADVLNKKTVYRKTKVDA